VRGKPESYPVNLAVLRSMAQAEYAPTLTGHFALASRHYSHFTSPIRRYPDLMVHRLLQQYLEGTFKTRRGRHEAPSQKRLEQVGRHCSDAERHAEAAENELKRVKILRLLGQRLGDVEKGIVTGVTKIGVFVQLRRYLVEGLARFGNLPDDWWDVDVEKGSVVGRQRGLSIRIGDQFPVQIVQVDIPIRELALAIPESALKSRRGKRAKPGSPKGDRKGTHANRSSGRSRRKRR
jgi:ribonuclease R